jgi:uncharacterized protein (DUF952 family)
VLLHIITLADWAEAQASGKLTNPSIATEGFIHCSYPDQVLTPANERYAGRDDLQLLVIDPDAVTAKIVVEDSYGSGTAFPHIYGPLNVSAVRAVLAFPRAASGNFETVPETGI